MKYVLDTNIYLGGAASEERAARFRETFFPLLPSTFLSAVVAYELAVNARGRDTRDLVGAFVAPMRRTGRVVNPTFDDWLEASEVITKIGDREPAWRSKLPALLNDVLIALTARQIGATVITANHADFRLIRRHVPFLLRPVDE